MTSRSARAAVLTLRHPRRVVGAWLALVGIAIVLLPGFRIQSDVAKLLPESDPLVRVQHELASRSAVDRELLVLLHGEDAVARRRAIAALLRESPWVREASTEITALLANAGSASEPSLWTLPEDAFALLRERLSPDGRRRAIEEVRERIAADPFGGAEIARRDPLGLRLVFDAARRMALPSALDASSDDLVGRDGDLAVVRVRGRMPATDVEHARSLISDVTARLGATPHELIGAYAISRDIADRMRSDLERSAIGSVFAIALYLMLTLRSLTRPLLVLAPVALGVFCALPLGAALCGPLTPLAISAAAILVGLGVDFGIHYATDFDALAVRIGRARAAAAAHRRLARPLGVCLATTVGAFVSLAFGRFPGFAGFGQVLALGLALAFAGSLTLLPLALCCTGQRRMALPDTIAGYLAARAVTGQRSRFRIRCVSLLLGVASAAVLIAQPIRVVVDPDALRPADDAVAHAHRGLEQRLGMQLTPRTVLVSATVPLPSFRAAFDELIVGGLVAFRVGPTVPPTERLMEMDALRRDHADLTEAALSDLRAAGFRAEQFRPALERITALLAAPPPSAEPVDFGAPFGHCHVVTVWLPLDGTTEALSAALHRALGDEVTVIGPESVPARLGELLQGDLIQASAITGVLCIALVLAAFGRVGLLALLPVALALGATLAAMSLSGFAIDQTTLVALPFVVGLGLDDGVHVIAGFRATGTPIGPLRHAIVRTSATSILGFGTLATATTPGLAALGTVLLVGTLACLMASLLVLPAWLAYKSDA